MQMSAHNYGRDHSIAKIGQTMTTEILGIICKNVCQSLHGTHHHVTCLISNNLHTRNASLTQMFS